MQNIEIRSDELKFLDENNSEDHLINILGYKLDIKRVHPKKIKKQMVIINDFLKYLKNKNLFSSLIELNNLVFILEYSNELFNYNVDQKFSIDIFSAFIDSDNNYWIIVFEHKDFSKYTIKNYQYKSILEEKKKSWKQKIEKIASYFSENGKLNQVPVNVLSCLFIREWSQDSSKEWGNNDKNNYLNGQFIDNINNLNIFPPQTIQTKRLQDINSFLKSAIGHNYLGSFLSEEKNTYTFLNDNIYESIVNEIHQNDNQGSLVFHIKGVPGSGKTAMAIELLKFIVNSYLLLLNKHFAHDIKFSITHNVYNNIYNYDISMHNKNKILTNWFDLKDTMNNIENKNSIFLIIDECQRLSTSKYIRSNRDNEGHKFNQINDLENWVNNGLNLILLGDNKQTIDQYDYEIDLKKDFLNKKNIKKHTFKLNGSRRFPNEYIKKIEYSFSLTDCKPKKNNLDLYFIEFYNYEKLDSFMENYKNNNGNIKIISKLSISFMEKLSDDDIETIKNYTFKRFHRLHGNDNEKLRNYLSKPGNFSIRENDNILWFDSYELISREVDEFYLYISLTKNEFIQEFSKESWDIKKSRLFVLLTRASQKLYVYFKDQELYEYCKKRLDDCNN